MSLLCGHSCSLTVCLYVKRNVECHSCAFGRFYWITPAEKDDNNDRVKLDIGQEILKSTNVIIGIKTIQYLCFDITGSGNIIINVLIIVF